MAAKVICEGLGFVCASKPFGRNPGNQGQHGIGASYEIILRLATGSTRAGTMPNVGIPLIFLWLGGTLGFNAIASRWNLGQVEDPPADAPACPALSKAHLTKFAENNTVLITVVDQRVMGKFGKSWVENVKAAGIGYWLVAALDPWTSRLLGHWGVKQCFNAPMERLRYKGSGEALETVFPCNLCSVRHAWRCTPPCGQEMGPPTQ